MRFKDIIEILRPVNCLMGSLTVVIGLLNTRQGVSIEILGAHLIFGIITYFFYAGAGNVINDIYDYNSGIDIINRPERALPSGRITVQQAWIIWLITLLIGLIFSIIHTIILNLYMINVIFAAFFGLIGWVYAKWGKKSGFIGNIIVSASFSIGLIYGAILISFIIPSYIYFFFFTAFFLLLSREIIKGCEDIEGDKKEGVKTLAIKLGIRKSVNIAMIFAAVAMVFFILTFFTNILSPLLFLFSMSFGLIIGIYAVILMIKSNLNKKNLKKISKLLKIGAFLGSLAFLFASFQIQ